MFFAASPRTLLLAIALGVLSGAASMALIAQVNSTLRRGDVSTAALLAFAAIAALRLVSALFAQLQLLALGQRGVQELRMKLSHAILAAPLPRLEELGAGHLLGVLSDDVSVIAQGGEALATFLAQSAFVAACCVYLLVLSVPAFGMVLVAFLAGLALQRKLEKRAGAYFFSSRADRNAMMVGFRGLTEGSKELKMHGAKADAFVAESVIAPAQQFRGKHIRGGGILILNRYWFTLLFLLLVGLLLLVWPKIRPSDAPVLVSYVLTVLYVQSTVEGMLGLLPSLTFAATAAKGCDDAGLEIAAKGLETLEAPLEASCETIEVRGITHEYRGEGGEGVFMLGPIDLTLRRGEIVFIVGGNGSGKSTLIKALTGLYVPQSGEIQVDGKPVTDATRSAYRQLFSAVFSDWYLFDRLFGIDPARADEEGQKYLGELQLSKKVQIKDGMFSTTALSQGQRKRLMLLTAYLEDRPVYVFDEWASDQDPVFKDVFYREILPRLKAKGKIVIVVSHDDRYFPTADKLISLEEGKIRTTAPLQRAS
jgi:putative ATP-binding cassette transporter